MIIESILSSIDTNGEVNLAPIGVHLADHVLLLSTVEEIDFYLYSGSKTFSNLQTNREGVINLTDDVLAFVETALFSVPLPTAPSHFVRPPRMADAKTIWEFCITNFDASREPAKVHGQIKYYDELAGFTGFCRAQWAVLEAAIMATRWQRISVSRIQESWLLWKEAVEKTGGAKEHQALNRVLDYFTQQGIQMPDPQ